MQLCTEVLVNKIERRWTSFSPNSIIIRPYIWTRKPILFRFNPFIFKDSIRHDEEDIPNHCIVPKPKNICIYIYIWIHTYAHLYHLIIMKHYLFLHIEKNLSVKHLFRLILKQPKHTHTRTHMNFLWFQMKNTEHSSIVSYGNEPIIMMIMCVSFSSSNSVSLFTRNIFAVLVSWWIDFMDIYIELLPMMYLSVLDQIN